MRLLKQDSRGWQYELNRREAVFLRTLLHEFPLTPAGTARITRTDATPEADARERLLNEALAERRQELKSRARALLAAVKLKAEHGAWRLNLDAEEREILLQVLNDIRVGSWRALGEPENLDRQVPTLSETELRLHGLLNLAGYFEYKLLNLDGDGNPA
ncbi:MAG: hypothetical protein KGJ60_12155 [Verrucomicrobiota bacterium]|nr:hypothetical protein [Verrucomicrobiota bacterium]